MLNALKREERGEIKIMMNDLNYKLMCDIGLDLDNNMNIIDQDFGNIIMIKGKALKASLNNIEPFIGGGDILFDPMNNYKLMANLFSYFIQKTQSTEDRYFNVFYPVQGSDNKTAMEIKENMTVIRSGFYSNPCIAYIDLVFRINDEVYDLSMYDSIPEPVKPKPFRR